MFSLAARLTCGGPAVTRVRAETKGREGCAAPSSELLLENNVPFDHVRLRWGRRYCLLYSLRVKAGWAEGGRKERPT